MPDGGPNAIERARAAQLYRDTASLGTPVAVPSSPVAGRPKASAQDEDEEPRDPVAELRQAQAAAAVATAGTASIAASLAAAVTEEAKSGELYGLAGHINNFLLQSLSELFMFDFSCAFLTVIFTFPLYDLIVIGIFGCELYNSVTGNKSRIPFFPTLTWESFMPPSTNISIPLSDTYLKIAVLACIILVGLANVIGIGLVLLLVGEAGAVGGILSYLFG